MVQYQTLFGKIIFMALVTLLYLYMKLKEPHLDAYKLLPAGRIFDENIRNQETLKETSTKFYGKNVHNYEEITKRFHTAEKTTTYLTPVLANISIKEQSLNKHTKTVEILNIKSNSENEQSFHHEKQIERHHTVEDTSLSKDFISQSADESSNQKEKIFNANMENEEMLKENSIPETFNVQDEKGMGLKDLIMKIHTAKVTAFSKDYKVVPDILYPTIGPSNRSSTEITICVQSSSDHIDNLLDLSQQWKGPISATIFASGREIPSAVRKMAFIHRCVKSVGQHVQFHLVFPVSDQPFDGKFNTSVEWNCDASLITDYLKPDKNVINYKQRVAYPVNFLRTVSLTQAKSPFVFTLDMDLIPSKNLYEEFQGFLKRILAESTIKINKTGFVIPSFESDNVSILNLTRSVLLKEWKKRHFRPFYIKPCSKCQVQTDYSKWRDLPDNNQLDVAYLKGWVDKWEPFYIAKRDGLPLFDGRFKQFGRNRVSQVLALSLTFTKLPICNYSDCSSFTNQCDPDQKVCEMHVAGYQFAVMNNAFVIHKGLKIRGNKGHYHDLRVNKALYYKFKSELQHRYPESLRTC